MTKTAEGKVPHCLLRSLISGLTRPGREVLIGPEVGEDAFAVGVRRTVLVGTTDPITFTSEHIGYYAVNVNANDVATMGARPRWFMATILVPPELGRRVLRSIFGEIDRTCIGLGVRLCGGHTEVTRVVSRPVVVGAMLGTVSRRQLVRPRRTRPGDVLVMTKRLAIEGTAIIARVKRREVDALLGKTGAARARGLLFKPGISVVSEALRAVEAAPIRAMHDPTEGGFIWGVKELSMATGLGVEVDAEAVPLYRETKLICDRFRLNPLGLIASGSLLVAAPAASASRVCSAIRRLGIECAVIGRFGGKHVRLKAQGSPVGLPALKGDEISKVV